MLTEIKRAVLFTIVSMVILVGAYHVVLWASDGRRFRRRPRAA